MFRKLISILILTILLSTSARAQIDRVEPPHWWIGFKDHSLQLLVKADNIQNAKVSLNTEAVLLQEVHQADSPNYLFLDLKITEEAEPGKFEVILSFAERNEIRFDYELKSRQKSSKEFNGFSSRDAIYLITPDRFANGDPSNDVVEKMRETELDRNDNYARHGGDIQGIIDHLDYIEEMGFTAIWSSPLLENDMPDASYHGYAITDFYKVDPRFGDLQTYKKLAAEANKRGIKLIMDMIANHCGSKHWWMEDLPYKNWINGQKAYENGKEIPITSHRRTTNQDPYASSFDKQKMSEGWFVDSMPDLNQKNPMMAKYTIQNSIWWIETLQLGGIRQDTYPYPNKNFMAEWCKAIMREYPNFNIVGEEWSYNPLLVGYWQHDEDRSGYQSYLPTTMDFPMQQNIVDALMQDEGWDSGLIKIYEGLANDFYYYDPQSIMLFADNHDMDRIHTWLEKDVQKTKMAMGLILTLPRIPQIYYGTEILMENSADRGDHGLIRSDFPGGWSGDEVNAFKQEGLSADQVNFQDYMMKLLNYRKNSDALDYGKTLHFAPFDGIYTLFRVEGDETVAVLLNKNENTKLIDTDRFEELELNGTKMRSVISDDLISWQETLKIKPGITILTTKLSDEKK